MITIFLFYEKDDRHDDRDRYYDKNAYDKNDGDKTNDGKDYDEYYQQRDRHGLDTDKEKFIYDVGKIKSTKNNKI